LKGYDYSKKGLYYVTICVKNRACLFGEIINHEMILNAAGMMVDEWYAELEHKYPDIKCHEHIVMPNHFHCIVENTGSVGADLCVCPENADLCVCPENADLCVCPENADLCVCPENADPEVCPDDQKNEHAQPAQNPGQAPSPNDEIDHTIWDEHMFNEHVLGEHIGSPLQRVMQWFKTMSTNEYIRNVKTNNWPRFDGKLWQRNYWEHIIRDEKSYSAISEYIINNPLKWNNDSINPGHQKI
jgi:REP element-mobilizing transposase RayT